MHMASAPIFPATSLASTCDLLAAGGDARLALDRPGGVNRYGCPAGPVVGEAAFGSCTASTISADGFAAAQRLRGRLSLALAEEPAEAVHDRYVQRIRRRLLSLCALEDGADAILAASGTDLCRLAADMTADILGRPLMAFTLEAAETGGGVPAALSKPGLGTSRRATWSAVAARRTDGSVRDEAEVEAELQARVDTAVADGHGVLLVLTDVSKTGLISPSPSAVIALRNRHPTAVRVLVDACQFRLGTQALGAYVAQGFMVALTGSKFVGGPAFCGALLVPPGYAASQDRPAPPNFGLLLRWEAALHELARFRGLDLRDGGPVPALARAIATRLAQDPAFEPLDTRAPDRAALGTTEDWDAWPTIFPFLLLGPDGRLDPSRTAAIHRRLMTPGADGVVRLGQPVAVGSRAGQAASALRLCLSAPLMVEAAAGPAGLAAVIDRIRHSLDRTALLASEAVGERVERAA
jgi:hypothetical protein